LVILEYDINGQLIPSLNSNAIGYALCPFFYQENIPEVVGNGGANGTLIRVIQVDIGDVMLITSLMLYSLVAPCTIRLATSNANILGDPSQVDVKNFDGQNQIQINNGSSPIFVHKVERV
jgi:hypothetical protein